MAEITASMVKELREKTNAGMMDCKKALTTSNGDMEAAVTFLREKGLAAMVKKGDRVAAEGLVGIAADGGVAAMVEVNCETDFVAKNPEFQEFVTTLAAGAIANKPASLEAFMASTIAGKTVTEHLTNAVARIGEKISVRRFARTEGVLGHYSHSGGSIGVIVELTVGDAGKATSDTVKVLAKDLAMQVAASAPLYLVRAEADPKLLDNERAIAREKARADGKPEAILDKIAEGAASKFLAENCLLEQAFIKDDKNNVLKHVDKVAKELGTTIVIKAMHRFKVGEGIEKKADDFAAEVAKMAGTS